MDNKPHLFRLLQLLAMLTRTPQPNNYALARDLSVDVNTLHRDGRVLRDAGMAQLEFGLLFCTADQLSEACRMASEPFGPT